MTFTPAYADAGITLAPSSLSQGLGTPLGFTFTAGLTGYAGGKVVVIVPTVFPTPNLVSGSSRITRFPIAGIAPAVSGRAVSFTVTSLAPGGTFWFGFVTSGGPAAGASGNFTFNSYAAPTGSPLLPLQFAPTVVVAAATPSSTPVATFTATTSPTPTLTPSPSSTPSPSATRTPLAGDGSAAISLTYVAQSTNGNTFTLTYTAGTNAWFNGTLTIDVPAAWSTWSQPDPAPDETPPFTYFSVVILDGGGIESGGGVSTDGNQQIIVDGIDLPAGGRVVVTYGDTSVSPIDGVNVPLGTGAGYVFQVKTDPQPYAGSTPGAIATSPKVDIDAQ
jgi:hypothetical protein